MGKFLSAVLAGILATVIGGWILAQMTPKGSRGPWPKIERPGR